MLGGSTSWFDGESKAYINLYTHFGRIQRAWFWELNWKGRFENVLHLCFLLVSFIFPKQKVDSC